MGAARFQMVSRQGRIEITPIPDRRFEIITRTAKQELDFFSVLSSGICAHAFASCGFTPRALCEWRPPEKRDIAAGRDLTESGAISAALNVPFHTIFNQDIFSLDKDLLEKTLGNPETALIAGSLQCDSFSPLKSARRKEADIATGEPGDRELFYPLLQLVETVRPAVLFLENVPGFFRSEIGSACIAILRRRGYHTSWKILNGADHGTRCSRPRGFLVASVWPNFQFPQPTGRPEGSLINWLGADLLAGCKDVTNTPLITRATRKARMRSVPYTRDCAPVFPKSQARVDDRVLFGTEDGRQLDPSVAASRKIHGIPEDFQMGHLTNEIAHEQIGQGVDYTLVRTLAGQIKAHMLKNLEGLI